MVIQEKRKHNILVTPGLVRLLTNVGLTNLSEGIVEEYRVSYKSKLVQELNEEVDITKYGDFHGMRFGQKVRLLRPGGGDLRNVRRFVGYEFEGKKDPSVTLIKYFDDESIEKSRIERVDCVSGRFGAVCSMIKEEDPTYDFYQRILDGTFVE